MARPTPTALTSVATNTDALEIIATVGTTLLLPELGIPVLVTGLATGLIKAAKLNAYLELANNLLSTVNGVLDLFLKLQQLGIIEQTDDILSVLKKGLIYRLPDESEIGLAELLNQKLTAVTAPVEGEAEPINLAQILEEIKRGLYWRGSDGHLYTIAETQGRLLLTSTAVPLG